MGNSLHFGSFQIGKKLLLKGIDLIDFHDID